MYLVKLSANNKSFHEVEFRNQSGINIVLATQKNPDSFDKSKTFNGVGKSLLISIIDFCLGSNGKKGLQNHLKGWVFDLEFVINKTHYKVSRSTVPNSNVFLNSQEMSVKQYRSFLAQHTLNIPEQLSFLTFRSQIPFFLRPTKSSYMSFMDPKPVNKDYQILISNAFFLGLDLQLIKSKFELKTEKNRVNKLLKDLKNDPVMLEFFNKTRDIKLALNDLDDQINKIERDLQSFEIAEDFYDIKKEADKISTHIHNTTNELFILQSSLDNINRSLKISPDLTTSQIKQTYAQAENIFKQESLKTLDDLQAFYTHISSSRRKRLNEQRNTVSFNLEAKRQELESLNSFLNDKLKYLNSHQALDVFINLSSKLGDLKIKKENIEKYDKLIQKYTDIEIGIKSKLLKLIQTAKESLDESQSNIDELSSFFKKLASRLYSSAPAGISVYVNTKDNNTIAFDIDAKIEADSSDGINNAKIFCYDLSLLLKGYNHGIDFLFHDSRLLDGIDPRQSSEMLKIANEYFQGNHKQYIISLNQNQISDIKQYLTDEEYNNIIEKNIMLLLTDSSPEEKLLGINIDFNHEK
ncbi:DUF2326 domain-containing protein [Deferribacteres bacterium DY0037]